MSLPELAAERLRKNLADYDADVSAELSTGGERADLWTEIDVNVEDLRTVLASVDDTQALRKLVEFITPGLFVLRNVLTVAKLTVGANKANEMIAETQSVLAAISPPRPTVSPEDEAEHFIREAIDSAPEPLRRLGEYLSEVLDEDQWKTAEKMLLGAAAPSPQGREGQS